MIGAAWSRVRVRFARAGARNADPMSSFGDFAALSDVVDVSTANVLKTEVV